MMLLSPYTESDKLEALKGQFPKADRLLYIVFWPEWLNELRDVESNPLPN